MRQGDGAMTTPYDKVHYPTTAFRQTHPDRLATHAALMGLPFAPPGRCRVLDIGGGDGMNIIGMALTHPGSQFVGFDLSENAVRRGQETILALGLDNVALHQADVQTFDPGPEPFDYVIAHGFYSWIPEPAREATLALIRRSLAPGGVAFLSYNAHPGGHVRQIVRDMMLFEVEGVTDPAERVARAKRKLEQVIETYPEGDPFQRALKARCKAVLKIGADVLVHDDLGEFWQPSYLREVLAHAALHGLQFLTEADGSRVTEGMAPDGSDGGYEEVVARAQDMDFRHMHGFRQTLLVRAEVSVPRGRDPGRLSGLYALSPARPVDETTFDCGERRYEIQAPALAGAVRRLSQAWPHAVPVDELVPDDEHRNALLNMYVTDLIRLSAEPSPFSTELSERPTASPLARLQVAQGETRLISLAHAVAEVADPAGRELISILDGSRTHAELAEHMAGFTGAPLGDVETKLQERLESLARMPMLVA